MKSGQNRQSPQKEATTQEFRQRREKLQGTQNDVLFSRNFVGMIFPSFRGLRSVYTRFSQLQIHGLAPRYKQIDIVRKKKPDVTKILKGAKLCKARQHLQLAGRGHIWRYDDGSTENSCLWLGQDAANISASRWMAIVMSGSVTQVQ